MADEEDEEIQRPLLRKFTDCYPLSKNRQRPRTGSDVDYVHQEGHYRVSAGEVMLDSATVQHKRWDLNYREAAIFLQEGENNDKFTSHPRSKDDLPAYMRTHNTWAQLLMMGVSLSLLILAVFEEPAIDRLLLPISAHATLELVCLLILAVELILRFKWLGPEKFFKHVRTMTKAVALVVMFIEAIVVIIRQSNHIRVTRALRPIFLLDSNYCRGVRRFIRQIILTIPAIVNLLVLLLLMLLLFSILGFYLFSGVAGDIYFQSFIQSIISLYVLMTTANYPDVMMPSYKRSRWSSVFFIIYISLQLFIFMNIFLAVVYSAFINIEKKKLRDLLLHRRAACAEAFHLLVSEQHPDLVSVRHFEGCMKYFRPRMNRLTIYLIFKHLNSSRTGKLTLEEFRGLYDSAALKWKKRPSDELWSANFKPPMNTALSALHHFVKQKWFDYFIYGVIFAHFIWIVIDTARISAAKQRSPDPNDYSWYIDELSFIWISGLFVAVYVVEATMKILGLGPVVYFASGWNNFDFVVTFVSLVGLSLQLTSGHFSYIIVLRPLRVLRLFKMRRIFRDVFGTLFILFKRMLSLAIVMLLLYYFFAIIGMEAFSSYTSQLINCCRNSTVEGYYKYNNESSQDGYYYLNTFENIFISGVTLFELTVVNNWWVIMEGFSIVSTPWARIYFMIFYLIIMVVMSVVVAFIFEAFIFRIQYRRQMLDNQDIEDHSIRRVLLLLSYDEIKMCQNTELSMKGDFIRDQQQGVDSASGGSTIDLSSLSDQFICYQGEKILNKDELSLKMYSSEVKKWIEEDPRSRSPQICVQLPVPSSDRTIQNASSSSAYVV